MIEPVDCVIPIFTAYAFAQSRQSCALGKASLVAEIGNHPLVVDRRCDDDQTIAIGDQCLGKRTGVCRVKGGRGVIAFVAGRYDHDNARRCSAAYGGAQGRIRTASTAQRDIDYARTAVHGAIDSCGDGGIKKGAACFVFTRSGGGTAPRLIGTQRQYGGVKRNAMCVAIIFGGGDHPRHFGAMPVIITQGSTCPCYIAGLRMDTACKFMAAGVDTRIDDPYRNPLPGCAGLIGGNRVMKAGTIGPVKLHRRKISCRRRWRGRRWRRGRYDGRRDRRRGRGTDSAATASAAATSRQSQRKYD